uniref:Uncharacterized protein n=1 Tax=viral metagenome TaxID=1070528 RepID=A0A6C0CPZ3_9ZZZZ
MGTFVNILILLAFTVTMLTYLSENTYEPFSGMIGTINEHYNSNKRKIRHKLSDTHDSIKAHIKRSIRKAGL